MENTTDGLLIAMGVLVFVIAVSSTMFLFSQLTQTAEIVYEEALKPGYLSEIEIDRKADVSGSKRTVNKKDIILALHRYPIQTVAVTILDRNGNEYQVFDKYIESQVRNLSSRRQSDLTQIDRNFLARYNSPTGNNSKLYLFTAPWIGSTQSHRERVNLFVNSEKGYINGQVVDYTNKGLDDIKSTQFIETVLNYKISGEGKYDEVTGIDVITSESGTYKTEIIYQAIN